jgi:hypothetical protein
MATSGKWAIAHLTVSLNRKHPPFEHLTHPNHPTTKMGIIPIDITLEETGCVWTFKMQ